MSKIMVCYQSYTIIEGVVLSAVTTEILKAIFLIFQPTMAVRTLETLYKPASVYNQSINHRMQSGQDS